MASFDVTATCLAIQTALQALNLFIAVDVTRQTSPPLDGPYATIWPASAKVVEVTLTRTVELHTLTVRLYRNQWSQDEQERVLESPRLAAQVMDVFVGDFDLGSNIRNVDVGGQYGAALTVDFTDELTAMTPTHVADITVGLIVDGATNFAA